jgi:hypothetical protein
MKSKLIPIIFLFVFSVNVSDIVLARDVSNENVDITTPIGDPKEEYSAIDNKLNKLESSGAPTPKKEDDFGLEISDNDGADMADNISAEDAIGREDF